ncbi:MAG: GMC family oxidoreductase [Gordonia sp. (in: high G+C Gram-positive bacteria)]
MTSEYDVVVVGGGLMGAAVAARIRGVRDDASIAIVDAGPSVGAAGEHLHDIADETLWAKYNAAVSSGVQATYAGIESHDLGRDGVLATPGVYHLNNFGNSSDELPGAAIGWNAGGMGVHWTAATPTPSGFEQPAFIDDDEWAAQLGIARSLLRVCEQPYESTAENETIRAVLAKSLGDVRAMPMAVNPEVSGRKRRTSPAVIFPPLVDAASDPLTTVIGGVVCTSIENDGHVATEVRYRQLATGATGSVRARFVVVCADVVRSPQLLWASGIRPAALGRNINEHAFVTSRVVVDHEALGIDLADVARPADREVVTGSYWAPHAGAARPSTGQINTRPIFGQDLSTIEGLVTSLSWYVPLETSSESFIEYSSDQVDYAGMPRMTVHFARTDEDLARIDAAAQLVGELAATLGPFDPATDLRKLPPGSSLHYTGTVRSGSIDDGTSVCDPHGKIWGMDNVYVAGTGVIPTPMSGNTTLAGMITAVRAAAAVGARLTADA